MLSVIGMIMFASNSVRDSKGVRSSSGADTIVPFSSCREASRGANG